MVVIDCQVAVHCSGFPCEDVPTSDVWSVDQPVTANNSELCSCDTGFQQCPPGMCNVVHVLIYLLQYISHCYMLQLLLKLQHVCVYFRLFHSVVRLAEINGIICTLCKCIFE